MCSATYKCLVLLLLTCVQGSVFNHAFSCEWQFSGQCKAVCAYGEFVYGTLPCGFGIFGTCCAKELPCSAYGGICRIGGCDTNIEIPFVHKVTCPSGLSRCCVRRAARTGTQRNTLAPPIDPGFTQCGTRAAGRVLGGRPVGSCTWPWMVSIKIGSPRFPGPHVCAGVLVSDNKVLTTASCVSGRRVYVTIGESSIMSRDFGEVDMTVTTVVHENFATAAAGGSIQANDIAILTLERSAMTDRSCASPVCLPRAGNTLSPTSQCYVAGWGISSANDGLLNEANVQVLSNAVCSPLYQPGRYPLDKICTSPMRDFTNTCPGDNGGMLVCQDTGFVWSLFGLISDNTCVAPLPVIYTNIQTHLSWIQANMLL